MPKSKNRRKIRSNRVAGTGAQGTLENQSIEGDAGQRTNRSADAGAVRKKSVGPIEFFQQVRAEARKVTWTSRGEVMVSTIMVLIMVAIMSLFFFAVDQLLRLIVPWVLSMNLL